ncbi:MAG: hypothetical protein IH840_12080 [Candidatus Heimdallarchaeota archaeon]|nr:hypothetical protein [Candidatus Heimdallarchaeota archaeon]
MKRLYNIGYRNALGINPYLADDFLQNGVEVKHQSLEITEGTDDLIIFNHVLGHLPGSYSTIKDIIRLLNKNGIVIIRIPMANCMLEQTYESHWFN